MRTRKGQALLIVRASKNFQHSKCFQKIFKENLLRELREHKRANRLLSRCGLVGARFAQQCNNFAPILLFCILDLFLLIYKDIDIFCKEDFDPKMLRIMSSHISWVYEYLGFLFLISWCVTFQRYTYLIKK